ncbi:hypothetical protein T190_22520 [Sinorhizobium meliloti CCBAU 01290]|nr:hypothetical protein T190_22520 [Sinorhizobium meliloti CCBAU 01290]
MNEVASRHKAQRGLTPIAIEEFDRHAGLSFETVNGQKTGRHIQTRRTRQFICD